MSDIADKIYAATGLTVNAETAAKVGHMIRLARQEAADEIEKLRETLGQTVTLFKEILDAIDADPAETKLVLRKNGVEVGCITAAECFDKTRAALGEQE